MTPTPKPARTLRDEHDRAFWQWCDKEELRVRRCGACGKYEWPPMPKCERCGGEAFSWERLSGRGKVRSFCTFERQYYPECPPPWTTILVELDEGPLFISDPDGIPLEALRDGLPVQLRFLRCRDTHGEFNLPVFGPG